ncbi:MAG: hypothetical protein R3253_11325, partial [Longimicrobiales bacterium]|nr:hypothetical protein [Longimicrobiales bacterium]
MTRIFLLAAATLATTPLAAQQSETLPLTWENIFTGSTGARDAALSPDGRTVAVAASTPDGSGVFLVEVPSGAQATEPRWLVEGASSPVWMPHGDGLLVSADGDLWIVSSDAFAESRPGGGGVRGQPRPALALDDPGVVRVTNDDEGERAAVPSPDGSTIAFYSGRGGHQDIWVVPSDGSAPPSQLTHESMAADDFRFAPAWSPDGSRIAYYSNKADYWEDDIWVVDLATGAERQVSRGLMASSTPVWSPDGSRIAL